jgi:hypothetical protein
VQYLFDVAVDQYLTVAYDSSLPGDLNRDGAVDAADYALWRKGLDNLYTQADHKLWRTHFGKSEGGGTVGSATVPEPTSAFLLLPLAAVLIRRRRAHWDARF